MGTPEKISLKLSAQEALPKLEAIIAEIEGKMKEARALILNSNLKINRLDNEVVTETTAYGRNSANFIGTIKDIVKNNKSI